MTTYNIDLIRDATNPKQPGAINGKPQNSGDVRFSTLLDQAARRGGTSSHGGTSPHGVTSPHGGTPPLVISKHAEARLRDRNINLTETQKKLISRALDKAESKGVKEALVLSGRYAFVADAKSRTVITALSEAELRQNVFTNIDGVVFT